MRTLYIMCGVGFSGKSTLAKKIAEYTGATLISQDELYFEKENEWNDAVDEEEQWKTLQTICRERIVENLKAGNSVVYDDVNTTRKEREELKKLASSVGAKSIIVFLNTPLELQKERQQRTKEIKDRHDVDQKYLDAAIKELEKPDESEDVVIFAPDTKLDEFLHSLYM